MIDTLTSFILILHQEIRLCVDHAVVSGRVVQLQFSGDLTADILASAAAVTMTDRDRVDGHEVRACVMTCHVDSVEIVVQFRETGGGGADCRHPGASSSTPPS